MLHVQQKQKQNYYALITMMNQEVLKMGGELRSAFLLYKGEGE